MHVWLYLLQLSEAQEAKKRVERSLESSKEKVRTYILELHIGTEGTFQQGPGS